jgi:hypothetical protein
LPALEPSASTRRQSGLQVRAGQAQHRALTNSICLLLNLTLLDTNQLIPQCLESRKRSQARVKRQQPYQAGAYHIQCVLDDGSRWFWEGLLFLASRKLYVEPVKDTI